jgi:hypothetical protein
VKGDQRMSTDNPTRQASVAHPSPSALNEVETEPVDGHSQLLPHSERSLINRFAAIITPLFVIAAGWLAGVVGNAIPGVQLDQSQIVAFMIAVATAALSAAWKWLQGRQQHERLVAAGMAPPRKPGPPPDIVESRQS